MSSAMSPFLPRKQNLQLKPHLVVKLGTWQHKNNAFVHCPTNPSSLFKQQKEHP